MIAGKGVGYGYAKSDDVLDRVDTFQKLAIRTIERKAGKSFRKAGKIPNELKDACQPFITVPSAASMAFRMKFGSVENITLSGFGTFENVIEDINDNIELIAKGDIESLKQNILDESYFNNFIGLTKQLAPDGDSVNLFGITSILKGKERRVELTSPRTEISLFIKNAGVVVGTNESDKLSVNADKNIIGVLSAADNLGKVRITTANGEKYIITVPDGLSDIVKTYWEEEVSVKYVIEKRRKILVDIDGI